MSIAVLYCGFAAWKMTLPRCRCRVMYRAGKDIRNGFDADQARPEGARSCGIAVVLGP